MFNIVYNKSVLEDIHNFPIEKVFTIVENIEKKLSIDPYYYPELKGNYSGLRRIKIGLFRAIFTVHKDEINILRIGKRH